MRIVFVDVLRLLALLQMVNGHTLDALLATSARTGSGFERYTYARGLVSVAFMVVAGISFHLTTVARLERHRADPRAVRRRFVRAAELVAIGYLLQLRWSGVYFDHARSAAALGALFRCEVLQCIGFSLLALELLALSVKRPHQLVLAAALAAAGVFALAPHGELLASAARPSLLAGLLGHAHGSQFPLLPWAGYVFAGVVIGAVALPESGRTAVGRRVLALALSALFAFALSWALRHLGTPWPNVRAASVPWFALEKLAVIALALALLAYLTRNLRGLPRPLTVLGGETLAIFVFHLQLIYGGRWALAHRFGRTLSLRDALLLALLNIALSAAFGLAYAALKRKAFGLRAATELVRAALRLRARYAAESRSASHADCTRRSAS